MLSHFLSPLEAKTPVQAAPKFTAAKKIISVAPESGAGVGELVPRAQKGVQKTMRD